LPNARSALGPPADQQGTHNDAALFDIDVAIGGGANATVAALAVRTARRAFGPVPQSWPATRLEP
jgi:hypothetical protein